MRIWDRKKAFIYFIINRVKNNKNFFLNSLSVIFWMLKSRARKFKTRLCEFHCVCKIKQCEGKFENLFLERRFNSSAQRASFRTSLSLMLSLYNTINLYIKWLLQLLSTFINGIIFVVLTLYYILALLP